MNQNLKQLIDPEEFTDYISVVLEIFENSIIQEENTNPVDLEENTEQPKSI